MQFSIKQKSVPAVFLDGWLVQVEKRAFGWVSVGSHTEKREYDELQTHERTYYENDVYVKEVTHETVRKTVLTTYQNFVRVSPYSFNVIFHLFEMISGVISWVRRWIMYLVDFILVLGLGCFVLSLLLGDGSMTEMLSLLGQILMLYVGLIVVPSLIIAAIGYGMRKLMGIDEAVTKRMEENGLDPDWRQYI